MNKSKNSWIALLSLLGAMQLASATSSNIVSDPVIDSVLLEKIIGEAIKEARKNNLSVSITVVDRSGEILAVHRDHRAGIHTLRVSFKKAFTANSLKRTTKSLAEGIAAGNIPEALKMAHENFTTLEGGLPVTISGVVVGGIGVGGGTGAQDAQIAEAALSVIPR